MNRILISPLLFHRYGGIRRDAVSNRISALANAQWNRIKLFSEEFVKSHFRCRRIRKMCPLNVSYYNILTFVLPFYLLNYSLTYSFVYSFIIFIHFLLPVILDSFLYYVICYHHLF